jgi:short-subunit dehydrogenase
MVERGRGGIVLVSSSAGTIGMPRMVVYGATKAFDLVFAEALWSEVHASGVDVLAPILAATDTPALRRLLAKRGVLTSEADDAALPDVVTPEEVVEGIIANLPEGPSWYAGESSRRGGEGLRKLSRNDAVRAVLKQTSVYKD